MIPDISKKAVRASVAADYVASAEFHQGPAWEALTFGVDTGASGGIFIISIVDPRHSLLIRYDTEEGAAMRDLFCSISERCRPGLVESLTGSEGALGSKSSLFKQGVNYGTICERLSACGMPYRTITSAKWQQSMRMTPKAKGEDRKKALLDESRRVFPHISHPQALADALLIGALAFDVTTGTKTFSMMRGDL
jgi:hypothetical protein